MSSFSIYVTWRGWDFIIFQNSGSSFRFHDHRDRLILVRVPWELAAPHLDNIYPIANSAAEFWDVPVLSVTGLDGEVRVFRGRSRLLDRRYLIIFQNMRCNKAFLIKHILSIYYAIPNSSAKRVCTLKNRNCLVKFVKGEFQRLVADVLMIQDGDKSAFWVILI